MYQWMNVTARTEIVYRTALNDEKMTIKQRIKK